MRPWLRRLATRTIAIIPAILTILYSGEGGTYRLLILSQVILSMQLPFAVIPLIRFTDDRARMGDFANRTWVKVLAWSAATLIVALNFWLVVLTIGPWVTEAPWRAWVVGPPIAAVLALLGRITFFSTVPRTPEIEPAGVAVAANLPAPVYRRILVPLDHSTRDRAAIAHAAAMARPYGATLHLLHVEEGVISRLFGAQAATAETRSGEEYFEGIVESLAAAGITAELTIDHGPDPKDAIVRKARELNPDLIVMGAHGHRGVKDLIFGNTINGVRHEVSAPVLVVGDEPAPGSR
jgi:manganese transport protein